MQQFHNKYLKVPLLFSGGGGNVPEWRRHLQPCEYIKSTGSSNILTNFDIKDINELEIKFYLNDTNSNYIFRNSNNTIRFDIYQNNGKYNFRAFCQNVITSAFSSFYANIDLLFKWKKEEKHCWFNGEQNYINNNYQTFSQNLHFYMQNNCIFYYSNSNLYNLVSCYVIDNYMDNKGNLCSSGVAGMVDTLTGVFYTNDGSGQFSHGEPIEIEI